MPEDGNADSVVLASSTTRTYIATSVQHDNFNLTSSSEQNLRNQLNNTKLRV